MSLGEVAERLNAPVSKTSACPAQLPSVTALYDEPRKSLSHSLPDELIEIIQIWDKLPDALKAGILAIVRSDRRI